MSSQPQILVTHRRAGSRSREPVLASLNRELRALACFPITFRSALDGVPFVITSLLVLFFAVAPGNNDPSVNLYGGVLELIKYMFAMFLVAWFALLAIVRQRINLSPLFPLAALVLSVAGVASFTYSIALKPGTTTYASALIPLLVAALPLVIPNHATRVNAAAVMVYLFRITGTAAIFFVLWLFVDYASGMHETHPDSYAVVGQAYPPVSCMILYGLFRRKILLCLSIALVGLSLLLRPSSTTGFIALFAIAVIVLHRLYFRRVVRVACVSIVGIIIIGSAVIFFSADVTTTLYSIEPLMKEDALDSKSNNEFRLAIFNAMRDEMADKSVLVGKSFSGDITVDASRYYPGLAIASVHSDYLIMIQQGGLLGYGVFASLFMGMALLCANAARVAHAAGNCKSETLFDAIQAMSITYLLCIAGNPTLAYLQCTLWYLMLIPLAVFLARAQPGFLSDRRRRTASCPRLPRGRSRSTKGSSWLLEDDPWRAGFGSSYSDGPSFRKFRRDRMFDG